MIYRTPDDITITIPGRYRTLLDEVLVNKAAALEAEVQAFRVRTHRSIRAKLPTYMNSAWKEALWLRELARQVMP